MGRPTMMETPEATDNVCRIIPKPNHGTSGRYGGVCSNCGASMPIGEALKNDWRFCYSCGARVVR